MNHKGGASVVTFIFMEIVFLIIWAFGLGAWISTAGQEYITQSGATGLEAFLAANINLVIFFCLFISTAGVLYFGGGE